jgi:serine/threonine protein kinase
MEEKNKYNHESSTQNRRVYERDGNSLISDSIDSTLIANNHYKNTFIEHNCIGSGRFGRVFRAQHRHDGNDYAVKKLLITGMESALYPLYIVLIYVCNL